MPDLVGNLNCLFPHAIKNLGFLLGTYSNFLTLSVVVGLNSLSSKYQKCIDDSESLDRTLK